MNFAWFALLDRNNLYDPHNRARFYKVTVKSMTKHCYQHLTLCLVGHGLVKFATIFGSNNVKFTIILVAIQAINTPARGVFTSVFSDLEWL
jgi:hypothetical protein